jgi:hypothetical protein
MPTFWDTPEPPAVGDHGTWDEFDAVVIDVDQTDQTVTVEIDFGDQTETRTLPYRVL